MNTGGRRWGILLSGFASICLGHQSLVAADQQRLPSREIEATRSDDATTLVHAAVYIDLVREQSEHNKNGFGAFFLEATGAEADYLRKLFRGHIPRVEIGVTYHRAVFEGRARRIRLGIKNTYEVERKDLMDNVTRKPAAIFWLEETRVSKDHATITAGKYAGYNRVTTWHYELSMADGKWTITKIKPGFVS